MKTEGSPNDQAQLRRLPGNMRKKSNKSPSPHAVSLKRVAIPHHRLKEGLKVMVAGTIKGIYSGNYVEIEIDDHICGMNVCTLRVHHAGVYEA